MFITAYHLHVKYMWINIINIVIDPVHGQSSTAWGECS